MSPCWGAGKCWPGLALNYEDDPLLRRVFVEPNAVAKRINQLTALCLPRRMFQPRAVVLVVLPNDLAVKFAKPLHFDRDG